MPEITMLNQLAISVVEILGNSLLPGIALVILVQILLLCSRQLNAASRHLIWLSVLAIILVLPAGNFIANIQLIEKPQATSKQTPSTNTSTVRNESTHPDSTQPEISRVTATSNPQEPQKAVESSSVPGATETENLMATQENAAAFAISLPANWVYYLFLAWLLGAIALLVRLAWGYLRLQHVKRLAGPLPPVLQPQVDTLILSLIMPHQVQIRSSSEVTTPMLAGLFDPVILIPQRLAYQLTHAELEQVVLHELAHLQRRDDWAKLLQSLMQAIFFFNPAVWWISRRLDFEREVACDDHVLSRLSEGGRHYANSLIKICSLILKPDRALLGTPMLNKTRIERRIRMILDPNRNSSIRISKLRSAAIFVVSLIFIGLAAQVSPAINLQPDRVPELQIESSAQVLKPPQFVVTQASEQKAKVVAQIPEGTYLYWYNNDLSRGFDGIQRTSDDGTAVRDLTYTGRVSNSWLHPMAFLIGDRAKVKVFDGKIYFADSSSDKILRLDLVQNPFHPEILIITQGRVTDTEIDEEEGKLYWSEISDSVQVPAGKIRRANLDGSNAEDLQLHRYFITDLAFNPLMQKLYWTENEPSKTNRAAPFQYGRGIIYSSDKDGSDVQVITSDLLIYTSLAFDIESGRLFWGTVSHFAFEPSGIYTSYWRGEQKQQLLTLPKGPSLNELTQSYNEQKIFTWMSGIAPFDLAIDSENQKIYWTLVGSSLPDLPGKIQRANLDGSGLEDVVTGLGMVYGLTLSHESSSIQFIFGSWAPTDKGQLQNTLRKLYWIDVAYPRIQRSNLNGSKVEDLVPFGIYGLYDDVNPFDICYQSEIASPILTFGDKIFYPSSYSRTTAIDLDQNRFEIIPAPYGASMDNVVDPNSGRLYLARKIFQESGTNGDFEIIRMNPDGTGIVSIIRDNGSKVRIAIDPIEGKLYWTKNPYSSSPLPEGFSLSPFKSLIKRANLDGSNIEVLFEVDGLSPINLEIDPVNKKIYWGSRFVSNRLRLNHPFQIKLFRSNFDGSQREILYATSDPPAIDEFYPCDFALDVEDEKLYIAASLIFTGKILRANLDGSEIIEVVTGLETPISITVSADQK